jgi:hypothetical protein
MFPPSVQHADPPFRLLRARRKRPRDRRAADERYELAAPHSITSSGRARTAWAGFAGEDFCGLQIDDECEFGGLLDRKLGRFGAAQNAPGIDADLAVRLGNIGPVAHQAARLRPFARLEHRRDRMARCQRAPVRGQPSERNNITPQACGLTLKKIGPPAMTASGPF